MGSSEAGAKPRAHTPRRAECSIRFIGRETNHELAFALRATARRAEDEPSPQPGAKAMSTSLFVKTNPTLSGPARHRSIAELLEPLELIAANSVSLIANHGARFHVNGEPYELPRYLFLGPKGGDDPI